MPKDAVEKGKSWTQKVSTKTAVGKISGETKFTYDGETDKKLTQLAESLINVQAK